MGCTLAPPGEYHWTIHVRQRCGLFVKLFGPLVIIILRLHCHTVNVDTLLLQTEQRGLSSVGMSLYHSRELLQKWLNQSRCHFDCGLWWAQGTHVLDGDRDPPWEGSLLRPKERSIVKYRDALLWALQKQLNRSRCCLGCGLGWAQGNDYLMGPIPPREGSKGRLIIKYRDCLPWTVWKLLNRSRCRLGCWVGWIQRTMH